MPHNTSPPPFIGLLGAFLALGITRVASEAIGVSISYIVGVIAISVGSIIGIVFVGKYLFERVRVWHQEKPWYEQWDSRIVSAYYRTRGRVLARFGVIGR